MKIGLEFEGVIRSLKTGDICRWPKIPEDVRKNIKKLMFIRREKVEPIDGYDCLAEVRTQPLRDPNAFDLLNALYSEMENASRSFFAHGFQIEWFEQEIPEALHKEITADVFRRDPEGKKQKLTWTIKDGKRSSYSSEGNLFRGGGLHINISSVPNDLADGLVMFLDKAMFRQQANEQYNHRSHYRQNLLFRTRYVRPKASDHHIGDVHYNDSIVEYMSYGFNVPKLEGWKESWFKGENLTYWDPNVTHVYWPLCLVKALNTWLTQIKEIH